MRNKKPWRIGTSYGIHIYEGDSPIATFHFKTDALLAVEAYNAKEFPNETIEKLKKENLELRKEYKTFAVSRIKQTEDLFLKIDDLQRKLQLEEQNE